MSNLFYYKPHIKIKLFADVAHTSMVDFYKPIEINIYPDDLELSCTIVRDCLQGNFALTCLIDVVNLSTYIKWQLLNKGYKYMIVTAGYLGDRYYDAEDKDSYIESRLKVIFKGRILWIGTEVDARKKVITRFLSVQNPSQTFESMTEATSIRYDGGYNLYQLISDIVRVNNNPNVKLNLSDEDYNQILETQIHISRFDRKSLDDILNQYGITISEGFDLTDGAISAESYIQMNSKKVPPDDNTNVVIVSEETGLINIPTLQKSGNYPAIRFKMLFDSRVKTFNYVKLRNSDIQLPLVDDPTDVTNLNTGIYLDTSDIEGVGVIDSEEYTGGKPTGWGYYLVLKITYSLESRGGNFIQEIEASPYNLYDQILGGTESQSS